MSSLPFTIWEILGKPLKFASKNVDQHICSVFHSKILRTRQNGCLQMLHILQSLPKYCCYDCTSSSWSVRKHLPSPSPVLLATVRAYAFLACLHCTYERVSPSSCRPREPRLDARHTVIWTSFSWIEMCLVRARAVFPAHFLTTQIVQCTLTKELNNKLWLAAVQLPELWDLYGFHEYQRIPFNITLY